MKKNSKKWRAQIAKQVSDILKTQGYSTKQTDAHVSVYKNNGWVGALLDNGDIQGSNEAAADVALAYEKAKE